MAAGFTYHPKPYDGEVTLVWAEDQEMVEDDPTAGWGAIAASVRIVPMGGGHIAGLNERMDELARALRKRFVAEMEEAQGVAVVTPSFARDFVLCRDLNASVLRFWPASTVHYVIVDARDRELFAALENDRTIVLTVEDVIPSGYFKLSFSKRWWMSTVARRPALGWLIQQLVESRSRSRRKSAFSSTSIRTFASSGRSIRRFSCATARRVSTACPAGSSQACST